jgi:hypothetical protein
MGWARELGVSGVQRIRIHYELYGAYTPLELPSERSSSQVAYPTQDGGEFPDDARNYWLKALMPWGLWFEEDGERLIMDYVGERPSFWRPDIHEEVVAGTFTCGLDVPRDCGTGPLLCPSDNEARHVEGRAVTGGGGADGLSDRDQDGIDDTQDCPVDSIGGIDPVSGKQVCIGRGSG